MRMELERMQQQADQVTDDVRLWPCLQYSFTTSSMDALYSGIYLYLSKSPRGATFPKLLCSNSC